MPRAVAFSHKQKKAQLQEKRAIKRGDKEPPPPPTTKRRKTKGGRPVAAPHDAAVAAVGPARLQSAFHRLPKPFLDHTASLAAVLPLVRPVPPERAVWQDTLPSDVSVHLACPTRPKWHYDMSKKEVERNEDGVFAKWLAHTDAVVDAWCTPAVPEKTEEKDEDDAEVPPQEIPLEMPRAPTSFERNPEVWRQLWRVAEISQIILVLLDSRCPLLHYPPSLEAYLASPHLARKRTILVLTKVDIAGAARADAWTSYLQHRFPHLRVVQVEAYAEKPVDDNVVRTKKTYEPHMPSVFRQTLVDALKEAHAELLMIKAPERSSSKAAKSRVKRVVNWDDVLRAHGGKVGAVVGGATAPRHSNAEEDPQHENTADPDGSDNEGEPEYLTVGLIGQPNVGKSSLLNALFGSQRVSASKTPGKTKHFQTLFWTPEVRLVDCPGLVMPNLVPLETQVLTGILPISRVSAVPLCIHHAGQLLPLEKLFALTHPAPPPPPPESDKRTWREPRRAAPAATGTDPNQPTARVWTTIDLLTAFALKHGWMTAKTGWPDTHRAGNAILRMLAEGRVRWAFWPPGTPPETVRQHQHDEGAGIWAADGDVDIAAHDVAFYDGVHERNWKEAGSGTESEPESEDDVAFDDEDEEDDGGPVSPSFVAGRFGALEVSGDDEDVSDKED